MTEVRNTGIVSMICVTVVAVTAIVANSPIMAAWNSDTATTLVDVRSFQPQAIPAALPTQQTLSAPPAVVYPARATISAAAMLKKPDYAGPGSREVAKPTTYQREQQAHTPTGQSTDGAGPSAPQSMQEALRTPRMAAPFFSILERATGTVIPASADGLSGKHPIVLFYDPRCPYCHQAYRELTGKVAIKWLPTLALGHTDEGFSVISHVLGDGLAIEEVVNPADNELVNQIVPASRSDVSSEQTRLDAILRGEEDGISDGAPTEAVKFVVAENEQVLRALYVDNPNKVAVPTMLVPRSDGGMEIVRGFSPEMASPILQTYRSYVANQ